MHAFESVSAAQAFIRDEVDVALPGQGGNLANGLSFYSYARILSDGRFTNIYDLSFSPEQISAGVHVHESLQSVYDFSRGDPDVSAAMSGGFFFLADRYQKAPQSLALNLAASNGKIHSLPVVDREAVIIRAGTIGAQKVQALGELTVNGSALSWAGSLTDHEADCMIFGNGNSRITHQADEAVGTIRVLDETSRYTPELAPEEGRIDVGFVAQPDGSFRGVRYSTAGKLDIFSYDVMARLPRSHLDVSEAPSLRVESIDSMALEGLQGALSVGPFLGETDFASHAVNRDQSLGSKPPFTERPMARTVLYETGDGAMHMRLFDGRPGSETFTGVTPSEAAGLVCEEADVVWGCFLDPGQTAKLTVRRNGDITSYGNRHYLKWPNEAEPNFQWIPDSGRPVASVIALQ